MTSTTHPGAAATPPPPGPLARGLEFCARWLEVYSQAAAGIARVGTVIAVAVVIAALAGNVFTRNVLSFSLFGAEELARFAFLWAIWLGVSLAVKRGAVTVITFVADAGPSWWQRSVKTFSGVSLGVLLVYCCWRSTEYATGQFATHGSSPSLGMPWFYPVVSMAIGYYFITLHYAAAVAPGAARLAAEGRAALRRAGLALAGAAVIGAVVWLVVYGLLEAGAATLIALGVIFVALTLAGTPIVFMLSIVGIIAFLPSFFGLEFFPTADPLVPFSTTQSAMGLTSGGELLVILMFLVVAEAMNASGMSVRLITFAAALVGHFRGGMAYVCQLTSALISGISGSAQADAAIMTPLLVPAMEREGYRRDVAAAVVAGASIKGPIGPLSIMFIVYGSHRARRLDLEAAAVGPDRRDPPVPLPGRDRLRGRAADGLPGQAPLRRPRDRRARRPRGPAGAGGPVHHPGRHLQRGLHRDRGVLGGGGGGPRARLFWLREHGAPPAAGGAGAGRARDRHRDAPDRRLGDPRQGALLRPLRGVAGQLLRRPHRQQVRLPAGR